eukprot:scaffold240658_cov55-Attheya_sp.AAC.3
MDKLLQSCICHMNLDYFWSRSSATVLGHKDNLNRTLKFSHLLGMHGHFVQDGPLPGHDHCGYMVAADMMLHSRSKGKNNNDYVQFDTIRKHRSGYGNFLRGAPQANRMPMSLEGLLLNLHGVCRHANEGEDENFVPALLGKIKGEHHELVHLFPCVHITDSGVFVKEAVDDLIRVNEKIGLRGGPAISDVAGIALKAMDVNDCLHEILEDLFDTKCWYDHFGYDLSLWIGNQRRGIFWFFLEGENHGMLRHIVGEGVSAKTGPEAISLPQ